MNQACQSAMTLSEMLSEAALFASPSDTDLTIKLEALRRVLVSSVVVSSEVEHEIVSLREVARLKRGTGRAERER